MRFKRLIGPVGNFGLFEAVPAAGILESIVAVADGRSNSQRSAAAAASAGRNGGIVARTGSFALLRRLAKMEKRRRLLLDHISRFLAVLRSGIHSSRADIFVTGQGILFRGSQFAAGTAHHFRSGCCRRSCRRRFLLVLGG